MLPGAYCVNVVCTFAFETVFMHGAEFLLTVHLSFLLKTLFFRIIRHCALLEWC